MKFHPSRAVCHAKYIWCVLVLGLWVSDAPICGQTVSIRITSPRSGSVVYSGSQIEVAVEASPIEFPSVGLNGDGPTEGWPVVLATPLAKRGSDRPPYKITVQIPPDASPGTHTLSAFGARGVNGTELVRSTDVQIDIERPDEPTKLRGIDYYVLNKVGETKGLDISADFADGTAVYIRRSHRNSYDIDPPGIVSVTRDGLIQALAPGTARIAIRNGHASMLVRAEVARPAPRRPVK
jgi:hypothetical protein